MLGSGLWWVLLCYFVLSRLAFSALALVWDHCHPEKQSCHSDAIRWYLMDLICINNYRSFVMSSSTRLKYRPKPWQSFYRVLQMAVACWWLSCLFPSCILKLIWSKTSHFCSSQIGHFCHRFSFQFLCNFDCFISFFTNYFDSYPFTETLSDEASANGRWINWKAKCICQDMTWFQILFICPKEIFRTAENTNMLVFTKETVTKCHLTSALC